MVAEIYMHLGAEIRRRREGLGLSQAQLADRVGVKRTSITMIERGAQAMLVHQFLEIARVLKVSPEKLLAKIEIAEPAGPSRSVFESAKTLELLSELEPLRRLTR